jgi:hypothetical protein
MKKKKKRIAGTKLYEWNGSPESFFHPRDVDRKAIASSVLGKIDLPRSY